MRAHLSPLRGLLVLLLVGSGILFLVGSTVERNHRHLESTKPVAASGESGSETGSESTESTEKKAESGSGEAGATILGVNTESLALSILAVCLSFVLAAAVWLDVWRRWVLIGVIAFGLVFAAGDARELAHQLNESNGGLAFVAAILIVLHLAVAAVAALLLRPRPLAGTPQPSAPL